MSAHIDLAAWRRQQRENRVTQSDKDEYLFLERMTPEQAYRDLYATLSPTELELLNRRTA